MAECVKALALCHNVTPVVETSTQTGGGANSSHPLTEEEEEEDEKEVIFQSDSRDGSARSGDITYQASSPDEVCEIKWASILSSLYLLASERSE